MDCFKDIYTHEGHTNKYKVFLVFDKDNVQMDRIADMGKNLPYPRLNTMMLGATWTSARTKMTYERVV